MKKRLSDYFPGIVLFLIAMFIGMLTYQDYGISWDEPIQRLPGIQSYNYIFHGDKELLTTPNDYHGPGFEIVLVLFEKGLHLTDTRDIFLMRHIVTHVFFLLSALFAYVLIFRSFRNKFLASIGFIILVMSPRIYAHSFFNSKDVPFLSMMLITLTVCQAAFDKDKNALYVLLGLACGYTTSIRIMGLMLFVFILLMFLVDIIVNRIQKTRSNKTILGLLLFVVGFCFSLYISWPYIWHDPFRIVMKSFKELSHFNTGGGVTLFRGRFVPIQALPLTYFPVWFSITTPVLWLIAGFSGTLWIIIDFFRKPLTFIKNTKERNFLLYVACFMVPVLAVLILHSVIYDDWRHLYFVYPAFLLMAIYFINKILQSKFRLIIQAAMVVQLVAVGYFMIADHPFQQIYFNELVSHDAEYLHKSYEMDYWGAGLKVGLEQLLKDVPYGTIKVSSDYLGNGPLQNNIEILQERDRKRIEITEPEAADYFITNFRSHPDTFAYPRVDYSIKVLNSTILCVYKTH